MKASVRFASILAACIAGVCVLAAGPARAQQSTVNVYNWSDYIDPAVLEAFTRETGIRLRYDTFDSNDTLEAKLLAGRSGYDVVVPSAYFLERQIKAGVFQPLDKTKLPNLANIWPEIEKRVAAHDPGNRNGVVYMWGTVGIGYDVRRARDVLGRDGGVTGWDILFKRDSIARFKDCGVYMLDTADDVFPAALTALGLNPNSSDPGDLERAADLLGRVRPWVRKYHSSEYLNGLAGGDICLALGWSGDVKQAARRAREARNGVEIGYAIPAEGTQMFFDTFAIPKDARNVAEAHAFIDYMLRPDVAAKNTNLLGYASGNLAAQKLIDPAILSDKTIYPDEATMTRLYTINARDAKTTRLMNRLWTKVKTGR